MLIRHLIQKLDEFKMCNLTMSNTISRLQDQNWRLERRILKLKGYDIKSAATRLKHIQKLSADEFSKWQKKYY